MSIFNKKAKNNVNQEKEQILSIRKTKLDENGMEYEVEEQHIMFNPAEDAKKFTLKQMIIENAGADPFLHECINNFLDNVNKTLDEKFDFLSSLVNNKILFNEFTKEIVKPVDADEIFEKYNKLLSI